MSLKSRHVLHIHKHSPSNTLDKIPMSKNFLGESLPSPPTDGVTICRFSPASDLLLVASWDSVSCMTVFLLFCDPSHAWPVLEADYIESFGVVVLTRHAANELLPTTVRITWQKAASSVASTKSNHRSTPSLISIWHLVRFLFNIILGCLCYAEYSVI